VPGEGPSGPGEVRAARWIAALFVAAIGAGLGLLVVYILGGQVQLEGALLAVAFLGLGLGLVLWGKFLLPTEVVTEDRGTLASDPADLERAVSSLERGESIARRSFLLRLLIGAGAALGVAAFFPIRSLGPGPGGALFRTSWRRGLRLVDEQGNPIRAAQLDVGGVVTVFPEGHTGAEDSQALLVRVEPDALHLPPGHASWAPGGNVCYSKICTHAGCPVGLYSQATHELICPCHQSAFLVTEGARPVFGPAARPLPQLGLYQDDQGFLRARGDFDAPVGPGFWNRDRGPRGA
jgi:ubiquinol-cytochrome c reductase iron-sulfur subunit